MTSIIKNLSPKDELKAQFKNGSMPNESNFSALIDAIFKADVLSFPAVISPPVPELPQTSNLVNLAPGWCGASAHVDQYQGSDSQKQIQSAMNLAMGSVPADGRSHPIMTGLYDCYGFEIVASASGVVTSKHRHAVTHAIVLLSFNGNADDIRQTCSCRSWDIRHKIKLRWKKSAAKYDLCIGTGIDFGLDSEGKPVAIQFHITRVW